MASRKPNIPYDNRKNRRISDDLPPYMPKSGYVILVTGTEDNEDKWKRQDAAKYFNYLPNFQLSMVDWRQEDWIQDLECYLQEAPPEGATLFFHCHGGWNEDDDEAELNCEKASWWVNLLRDLAQDITLNVIFVQCYSAGFGRKFRKCSREKLPNCLTFWDTTLKRKEKTQRKRVSENGVWRIISKSTERILESSRAYVEACREQELRRVEENLHELRLMKEWISNQKYSLREERARREANIISSLRYRFSQHPPVIKWRSPDDNSEAIVTGRIIQIPNHCTFDEDKPIFKALVFQRVPSWG